MLAWEAVRDVGRTLPWLASERQPDPVPADLPAEKRAELFKIHAEALRYRHGVLYAVIDRAGKKLAATLGAAEPGEILDPEGEGCEALEKADACFKTQRDELGQLREGLIGAGAPFGHDVFEALDRLDGRYSSIIATTQEVRWGLLIADGLKEPGSAPTYTSGAALVAALDDQATRADSRVPRTGRVFPQKRPAASEGDEERTRRCLAASPQLAAGQIANDQRLAVARVVLGAEAEGRLGGLGPSDVHDVPDAR